MTWIDAVHKEAFPSDATSRFPVSIDLPDLTTQNSVTTRIVNSVETEIDVSSFTANAIFDFNIADFTIASGDVCLPASPRVQTVATLFEIVASDSTVLHRSRTTTTITVNSMRNGALIPANYSVHQKVELLVLEAVAVDLIREFDATIEVFFNSSNIVTYATATASPAETGFTFSASRGGEVSSNFTATHTLGVASIGETLYLQTTGMQIQAVFNSFYYLQTLLAGSSCTVTRTRSHPRTGPNNTVTYDMAYIRQPVVPIDVFASTCDLTDALWAAPKTGNNSQLYRTRAGFLARETKELIPNCKATSMWFDAIGALYVFGQNAGGAWQLWRSEKFGETDSVLEIGMQAFDSTYKKGDAANLKSGFVMAIAIEPSTKKLYSKTSVNSGQSWSEPVIVATLTTIEQFNMHQPIKGGKFFEFNAAAFALLHHSMVRRCLCSDLRQPYRVQAR